MPPVLKGHLGKDITYLGFDIAPANIDQFFFILEEQMTEPRFGFDEPDSDGQNGPTWLDVDWSEVHVNGGEYFGSARLKQAPPAKARNGSIRTPRPWPMPCCSDRSAAITPGPG